MLFPPHNARPQLRTEPIANPPSEPAYFGQLHASEGAAERSLETAQTGPMSLGEGRSWQIIYVGYRGYSHSMVAGGFDEIS